MKIFKQTLGILLAITILIGQNNIVSASSTTDTLAPYRAKLVELNEELSTDYKLEPTDDSTYDEMVSYYTNMTIRLQITLPSFPVIKNLFHVHETVSNVLIKT